MMPTSPSSPTRRCATSRTQLLERERRSKMFQFRQNIHIGNDAQLQETPTSTHKCSSQSLSPNVDSSPESSLSSRQLARESTRHWHPMESALSSLLPNESHIALASMVRLQSAPFFFFTSFTAELLKERHRRALDAGNYHLRRTVRPHFFAMLESGTYTDHIGIGSCCVDSHGPVATAPS